MNDFFQKYCLINIKGLEYMGVGYEDAVRVMGIHLTGLAGFFAFLFTGILAFFDIDRKLLGVIGVILLGLFFLLFWMRFKKVPSTEEIILKKSTTILLTVSFHVGVISIFCLTGYFFFRN